MAEDYTRCNPDCTLSQERKPNAKIPHTTLEETQESSSSDLINEVALEMVLNPVGLPIDCGNAISEKDDSIHSGEARDKTDSLALVERLEKTEEEEMEGFEVEKVGNGCTAAAPLCVSDCVQVKPQLSCGLAENVVLGKAAPNLDMSFAILENREKGFLGIGERLELNDKMRSWGNTTEGALKKCSLNIAIVDETALIETSEIDKGFRKDPKIAKNVNGEPENGGNRERRPRRKGKSGKNKNFGTDGREKNHYLGHTDCGIGMLDGVGQKRPKNVYSRKELEGLRHVGLEWQRKKWAEIFCGLGPAVQQDYNGLVGHECHHQHYNQKQNRCIRVDCSSRPSNFSEESSGKIEDNEITEENLVDFPSGFPPVNHENGCIIDHEWVEDDSDEEYSSIQKPAFFVSGEPNFDSGPPEDGLEYLRRVRWEAAKMPKVKVAKVDKSKLNKEQTNYMPQIPDVTKCPEQLKPLKEWEDAFLADFSDLRLALSHYGDSEEPLQSSAVCKEALLDSAAFEIFDSISCEGESSQSTPCFDNDGSDSVKNSCSKPSESGASLEEYPTLSTIVRMNSVARVSMLRKRINMAESKSNLSRNDCLWLFALSAAVDSPLDADTCASFRSLLRKCASLRAEKVVVDEEVAMLNILATISGRYFGQLGN